MDRDALIASLRSGGAFVGETPRVKGTRFPNMSASREGQAIDLTLAEWAEYRTLQGRTIAPQPRATQIGTRIDQWKFSLPVEVGAVLKDGRRNRSNVEAVGWLFFDVDHGTTTWDALRSALDALGAAYLLSESSTHGINKETCTADESATRYHCYLPLVAPLVPVGNAAKWNGEVWAPTYRVVAAALSMLAGVRSDGSVCDAARGVYVPMAMLGVTQDRKVIYSEGGGLDVAAFVAALPPEMRERPKAEKQSDADRSANGEANTPDGDFTYKQPEGEMFTYSAKGDARLTHAGLITVCGELGILRRQYAPGKWATVCPWVHLHGSGAGSESSTALLIESGSLGVWKCSHDHSKASNESNLGPYGTQRLVKLAISRGILSYPAPKNEAPEAATSEADQVHSTVSDTSKVANHMVDVKPITEKIAPHDLKPRTIGADSRSYPLTEAGDGERLAYRFGSYLRHDEDANDWYVWDGRIWTGSKTGADVLALRTVRLIASEEAAFAALAEASAPPPPKKSKKDDDEPQTYSMALRSHAGSGETRKHVTAMTYFAARSAGDIPARRSDFDRDRSLLTVANGTIDLSTGALREHRPSDMITSLVPIAHDATATCPTWDRFVSQSMCGNVNLIAFLSRAAGLCLTGDVSSEAVFVHHGSGNNGKGTFFQTIMALLGNYATPVTQGLLTAMGAADKASPGNQSALAQLVGKRLAVVNEFAEGDTIDDAMLKTLGSKDEISAKFMGGNYFRFAPSHHLHIMTNPVPSFRVADNALKRRLMVIHWAYEVPAHERDNALDRKLAAELPGILNWCLAGLADYRVQGLNPPAEVIRERDRVLGESDTIGQFVADRLVLHADRATLKDADLAKKGYAITIPEMREMYETWCHSVGATPYGLQRFGRAIEVHGLRTYRTGTARYWVGARVPQNQASSSQAHAPN